MNGYKVCPETREKSNCDKWRDAEIFQNMCSVEYGVSCIKKQGLLGAPNAETMFSRGISQNDPYQRTKHPDLKTVDIPTKMLLIIE